MSSVVLISDLLYQSAGIVFLDGGRVSEELVMVSLAFHLFVVGTVIFASVLLCQVKSSQELLYSFTGKCATHKATKTVYICKRLRSTQQHVVSHTSQYTINTKHNHHYSHDTSSSLETLPVDAKIDIRNWLVLEWPYSSCHFQLFRQIYPEFCALKL